MMAVCSLVARTCLARPRCSTPTCSSENADAFDALTFDRPYSKAISMADARERIRIAAGTHFDPDVVATFLAMPLDVFETARARSADRPVA